MLKVWAVYVLVMSLAQEGTALTPYDHNLKGKLNIQSILSSVSGLHVMFLCPLGIMVDWSLRLFHDGGVDLSDLLTDIGEARIVREGLYDVSKVFDADHDKSGLR